MAQEPLLYNCFENNIKNRRGKLLNKEYIYLLRFQGDGATIKDTPLLNILAGGVYLHISVQKIVHCADQITGGHKNDAKFIVESFFDPINELYPEKKLVDLCMFNCASVCRKAKNIVDYLSHSFMYFWSIAYLP